MPRQFRLHLTPSLSHLRVRKTFSWMVIILLLAGPGLSSCKGKKKREAEERARIEAQELADRERYLNDIRAQLEGIATYTAEDLIDLERKERELAGIENLEDWQESDILVLIRKAKYHLSEERDRLMQQSQQNDVPMIPPAEANMQTEVESAFNTISNATNAQQANAAISQALDLFASPDAPVLIIISNAGDYDRPTTISRYLNYLKDQQRNPNRVHRVVLDNRGLIREIELIKSQLRP